MTTALRPGRSTETIAPFPSDLAYLEAELQWVTLRCQRIGTERRLSAAAAGQRPNRWEREEDHDPRRLGDRLMVLMAQEDDLRRWIDACREASRREGAELALDRLCEAYALSAFERHVLLLAAAPCFSASFEEALRPLRRRGRRRPGLSSSSRRFAAVEYFLQSLLFLGSS